MGCFYGAPGIGAQKNGPHERSKVRRELVVHLHVAFMAACYKFEGIRAGESFP